jgi:hypothetical protein
MLITILIALALVLAGCITVAVAASMTARPAHMLTLAKLLLIFGTVLTVLVLVLSRLV